MLAFDLAFLFLSNSDDNTGTRRGEFSGVRKRDLWWWSSAEGKARGFEVKYQDAPTITKSMRIAMQDLKLERLWVVYPGKIG